MVSRLWSRTALVRASVVMLVAALAAAGSYHARLASSKRPPAVKPPNLFVGQGGVSAPGSDPFLDGQKVSLDVAAKAAPYHIYTLPSTSSASGGVPTVWLQEAKLDDGQAYVAVQLQYPSGFILDERSAVPGASAATTASNLASTNLGQQIKLSDGTPAYFIEQASDWTKANPASITTTLGGVTVEVIAHSTQSDLAAAADSLA